jgi:hypothetical protein
MTIGLAGENLLSAGMMGWQSRTNLTTFKSFYSSRPVRVKDTMRNIPYFWSVSCTTLDFQIRSVSVPIGATAFARTHTWRCSMLWTIFVLLLVLWLLGMVTSYTLGGFIHILLILAIATVLIRIIQGRNPI